MIGAYLRVSSPSQTLETQQDAIVQCAKAHGERVSCWYAEKASGRSVDRPELARLLADVHAGKVRKLYVFRLDRLTRSGIRDTLGIVEQLRAAHCELVTVGDAFRFEGPAADVVLAVLAWCAQVEREAIGSRIRAARERIEAKGGAWGRPSRMTAEQLARAQKYAERGWPQRRIAQALKVPQSTVQRALAKATRKPGPKNAGVGT